MYLILFSPVGLGGKPVGGLLEKSSLILEKDAHAKQNRFKSTGMARIKKQITANGGHGLENSEPSYITGGNGRKVQPLAKQTGSSSNH